MTATLLINPYAYGGYLAEVYFFHKGKYVKGCLLKPVLATPLKSLRHGLARIDFNLLHYIPRNGYSCYDV